MSYQSKDDGGSVFVTNTLAALYSTPRCDIGPLKIDQETFALEIDTPIYISEVLEICKGILSKNTVEFDGNTWVKLCITRFLRQDCLLHDYINNQYKEYKGLNEAYIWAGRLDKGECFDLVVKKFKLVEFPQLKNLLVVKDREDRVENEGVVLK